MSFLLSRRRRSVLLNNRVFNLYLLTFRCVCSHEVLELDMFIILFICLAPVEAAVQINHLVSYFSLLSKSHVHLTYLQISYIPDISSRLCMNVWIVQ